MDKSPKIRHTAVTRWKPIVDQALLPYAGRLEALDVLAIIFIESKGNPQARNPRFPAIGLMGVVAREAGKDFRNRPTIEELYDPRVNIEWGVKVLAWIHKQSKGSWWETLYRYSGGTVWPDPMDYVQKYWVPFGIVRADLKEDLSNVRL